MYKKSLEKIERKIKIVLFGKRKKEEMVIIDEVRNVHRKGEEFKKVSFWRNNCRYTTLTWSDAEIPPIGETLPYSELQNLKISMEKYEELER